MDEVLYRALVTKLGFFAQMLQQDVKLDKYPQMEIDRTMIYFKVREIQGYLRDMMNVIDAIEHPDKMHASFTPNKAEA